MRLGFLGSALVLVFAAGCGDDSGTPSCVGDDDCPANLSCFEGFCINVPRADAGGEDAPLDRGLVDSALEDSRPVDSGEPDTFDAGPVPMRSLAAYPGCERDADCPIGLGRCLTELAFNLPDAEGTTTVSVQSIDPSLSTSGICTLPCTEDAAACEGLRLRTGDMPAPYQCQVVVAGVSPYDASAVLPFAVDPVAAAAGQAFAAICRPPFHLDSTHPDSLCEPCDSDEACGAGALCWNGVSGARGTEAAPGECIGIPSDTEGCVFGFEEDSLVESDGTTPIGEFCVPLMGTCGACQDGDGDGRGVGLCVDDISPSPIDCDDADADAYFDPLDMSHAFPTFCGAFDKNCNGESDDAEQFVSAEHCGGCGQGCSGATGMDATAATRQCQPDGSCGIACDRPMDQADCDGNNENGCEIEITDPTRLVYYDSDGDGDGTPDEIMAPLSPLFTCTPGAIPAGYSATNTDCDDGNSTISGASGVDNSCDNVDQDCDGTRDEAYVPVSCSTGMAGICDAGTTRCGGGGSLMCNRNNGPAAELCTNRGVDNDCDGSTTDVRELDPDDLRPTGIQVTGGAACTVTSALHFPVFGSCQSGTYRFECFPHDGAVCAAGAPTADSIGNGIDEDCDGVDGTASEAVYVSTTGSDSGAGTPTSPYRTLQRGIDRARALGRSIVRVAQGTYTRTTPLKFHPGVTVVGRFIPASGWTDGGSATTLRVSYNQNTAFNGLPAFHGSLGLTCQSGGGPQGGSDGINYEVNRYSSGSNGESLIGGWFRNCSWLRLRNGGITVADAAAQSAAAAGNAGTSGNPGVTGGTPRPYRNRGRNGIGVLSALWMACGDDDAMSDAAVPDAPTLECTTDEMCDDDVFCNGVEHCFMGECTSGTAPCDVESCDEAQDRCNASCAEPDADGDGVDAIACGGTDCDDTDATRFPGNTELCDDRDQDCDPATLGDRDLDGDGAVSSACCDGDRCGTDCADGVQSVHPGAVEVCDFIDQDCDGSVDEGVLVDVYEDLDGDLHGSETRMTRACPGEARTSTTSIDCDDENGMRHGLFPEIDDDIDNDCDEEIDENIGPSIWYRDSDGDGHGDASESVSATTRPEGYSALPNDCDDEMSGESPTAEELCNGVDDNCDGYAGYRIAPGDTEDDDHDGHGDAMCGGDDCDDRDEYTYLGAAELCDGVDNDCDGEIDEGAVPVEWYVDADGDGYGTDADSRQSCGRVFGRTLVGGDCDDDNPRNTPGRRDVCDGEDNDCDGEIDETGLGAWAIFTDADGDGYGDPATATPLCFGEELPEGSAFRDGDCNDASTDFHPGAAELCDASDNDCDDTIDEDVMDIDWYNDLDEDGYGAGAVVQTHCARPEGLSATSDDCDDDRDWVHPGRMEICDGIDQDCDTDIDEGVVVMYYLDADGDGYGTTGLQACPAVGGGAPSGYAAADGDCAPTDNTRYPTATEICDEVDQDCDERLDEGLATMFYYPDGDGDGFAAVTASGVSRCGPQLGEVADRTDCNDMDENIYPMATEVCNGIDDDCDMLIDDGAASMCVHPQHTGVCEPAPVAVGQCACSAADLRDCDRDPGTGCEVDTTNDRNNCGGCGVACRPSQVCVASTCEDTHILSIVPGSATFGVVRERGLVQAWGSSAVGMFASDQRAATEILATEDVYAIDLGNFTFSTYKHRCAIINVVGGRQIQCQGINTEGQLGLGVTSGGVVPYQPIMNSDLDWTDVAVGEAFTIALRADGTVYSWGRNGSGQLGRATGASDPTPMVTGITDAVAIAASLFKSCAVRSSGQVYCWGNDSFGGLGNGVEGNTGIVPGPVVTVLGDPISDIVEISMARYGGCARTSLGQVWCWGSTDLAGLGASQFAVSVYANGATHLSCGTSACCLAAFGTARCWGAGGADGRLGSGAVLHQPNPEPVELLGGAQLFDVVDVAMGNAGGCALLTGDRVVCWGDNAHGELGDTLTADRLNAGAPTFVEGL